MSRVLLILAVSVALSIIPIGAIFNNIMLDIGLGIFSMLFFIIHMKKSKDSEYEVRDKEPIYEEKENEPIVSIGQPQIPKPKLRKPKVIEEEEHGSLSRGIGHIIALVVASITVIFVIIPMITEITIQTTELNNTSLINPGVYDLLSIIPLLLVAGIIISIVSTLRF